MVILVDIAMEIGLLHTVMHILLGMCTNRQDACKALEIHYLLIERDVTFEVLGSQQKCIGIYGKVAMPPFKLRATPHATIQCVVFQQVQRKTRDLSEHVEF